MSDLKHTKPPKIKANRRQRQKRDGIAWRKLFHVALRYTVLVSIGGMLLVGGIVAVEMVATAQCFRVQDVLVSNNQRVDEETIIACSGMTEEQNIFAIDLAAVGAKIEEHPWIAVAQVTRHFPHEVKINVKERQPLAIINLGYLYYVDAGGEVFKVLDQDDVLDYPVITGIDRDFLLNNPHEAEQMIASAIRLVRALVQRDVFTLDDVSEFRVSGERGVELYTLVGGVPIKMGHDGYDEKLDRLERVFDRLRTRLTGLRSIDLNVADRVIVKVAKSSGQVNS
ncbi:MAG: FtsQ-type POTRA domain-containing protein [Desulfuromonadales bacterium]|nr:FtsQ-type POTRA domain-containing protein [Desulfuromonadales bacterium]MDT8423388.1 FtsQ-type POTRA domain-containing protein [Desulfuromonadales bacterium]